MVRASRVLKLGLLLALSLPSLPSLLATSGANAAARGGGGDVAAAAADVARAAAGTHGTLPVDEALRAVTMPAAAARRAGEALAGLGFETALDLELLGGGDAASEVLAELKAGGVGPADRAKVRLLVGDREHLERLFSRRLSPGHDEPGLDSAPAAAAASDGVSSGSEARGGAAHDQDDTRRKLQSSGGDSGISADTIAIVLSVLVGAAGYVIQVAQTSQFLSFSLHGRLSFSLAVFLFLRSFSSAALVVGVHSSAVGAGAREAGDGEPHRRAGEAAGAPDDDCPDRADASSSGSVLPSSTKRCYGD
eukprot:SAG31_NODE_2899_length_4933_cov_2.793795_5_plen_307_part_00